MLLPLSAVLLLLLFPAASVAAGQEKGAAPERAGQPAVDFDPVRGDDNTADWDTPWGPLSQYDRNLLINVRWANLWEGPTSEQMAQRSTNPKVKAVAEQLSKEHHVLDVMVAETVAKLGVPLPDSPTPLQQSWIDEILGKSGSAADDAWSNITREAHGSIFMSIAQVRTATQNDLMREFAQIANEYVLRHMTLLESTGLVRASSLYVGSTDGAPHQIMPSWRELVLGIALACLVVVLTFLAVRMGARYEPRTAAE
ncbi:DUF4142 domain-containing protein [Saccharothrix coeruleofusca]|uniref:DUF4142 domain-containing protein n=1 Tax=Saccharothrix coeruleofusca TaxID=33919 RepID=A0A918EG01_9PSEU|nr:DUF4142 domain-containing protein [Saccharothrix coeruleofusca]MBP2334946.1 putative outer membrane protein [Saccharothrix coeruleofusca]GGP68116.1 hypothetical protein GCM10010185_46150 [Saccharothrix coeruleofusca]